MHKHTCRSPHTHLHTVDTCVSISTSKEPCKTASYKYFQCTGAPLHTHCHTPTRVHYYRQAHTCTMHACYKPLQLCKAQMNTHMLHMHIEVSCACSHAFTTRTFTHAHMQHICTIRCLAHTQEPCVHARTHLTCRYELTHILCMCPHACSHGLYMQR